MSDLDLILTQKTLLLSQDVRQSSLHKSSTLQELTIAVLDLLSS
jgi:hypothetical protein